jgi:site-specific DNA-methyltransferase (adenine-specific)
VRSWFVTITDDVLAPVWKAELRAVGRYVFQPLPFLEMGKQPRLTGDGPASWACWIVVARPMSQEYLGWGSLPGGYVLPVGIGASDRVIKGGKPLWLMRALVRDYSRPGDLVCDPCAGAGTTLQAALIEGRSAIGAELDPATHALAMRRLSRGYTPAMFEEGGEP